MYNISFNSILLSISMSFSIGIVYIDILCEWLSVYLVLVLVLELCILIYCVRGECVLSISISIGIVYIDILCEGLSVYLVLVLKLCILIY